MKNKTENYCASITWDNTDPTVYGPFKSEAEAKKKLQEITDRWGDWEWGCQTGHRVSLMKN